jgi:4-amino-4-deoxy-L-arabinose transferase-like glycosyltransferase
MIKSRKYLDIIFVLLFFVLGSIPTTMVFLQRSYTFFYQNFTPESVMWACGYGMRHPQLISEQLGAFLLGRVQSFDCAAIDPNTAFGPIGLFASVQPYLTWSAALLWRLFGVEQSAILPLVTVLAGLSAAGYYVLARLFLGRFLAILAGVVLCLSPVSTEMAIFLRDSSKAPFFLWGVAFLLLALRSDTPRSNLTFATLAGAIIGVGYGFRADLAILVPIGFVVLAVYAVVGLRTHAYRLLAPVLFPAAAILAALPLLLQLNIGTNGGSLAIQGASEYFREYAGMGPAGYALAWTYSDELTLSEVAAAERPKVPNWDALDGPPIYDVSEAAKHSTSYLLSWAPLFAADFATQALKSATWVLGFPALFVRTDPPTIHAAAKHLLPLYEFLGKPWMPLVGLAGFVALLWRAHLRSPTEAFCILLLMALLIGYPGIQFSLRHAFHLEFVWVVCVLSLLAVAIRPALLAQPARRFAIMLAAAIGLGALAYAGLVQWQRWVLSEKVAALLSAPREALQTQAQASTDGSVFHALPVSAEHAAIVASEPDAATPNLRWIGIAWAVRAEADRLVVTIGGARCPAGAVKVRLAYEKAADVWQPMDTDLRLTVPSPGGSTSAFFPAFYRPTQHFSGIALPASHAECTVGLERISGSSTLPLVMSGEFADRKLKGPLNKGFGSLSVTSRIEGNITRPTSP